MSNAYPLVFALGCLAGLLWLTASGRVSRRGRGEPAAIPPAALVDAGLASLAAGLVGARLAYVAAHATYFVENLGEILAVWQGGLSWAGGALGAAFGLAIFALFTRQDGWRLADHLVLPAVGVAGAAWLGCLLDGWAYGLPMESGWGAVPSSGLLAESVRRWPTQWLGILASLATLACLVWLAPRLRRPGLLASIGLAMISAACLGLSVVRADPVPLVHGLRLEAIGSAVLLIASLAMCGVLAMRSLPGHGA